MAWLDWLLGRRRRLLREPLPAAWRTHLETLHFVSLLPAADLARLSARVRVFVEEKDWEGHGGIEVSDRMKVVIAAQASLIGLRFDDFHYDGLRSIVIYPEAFARGEHDRLLPDEDEHEDEDPDPLIGEAHEFGTVVLSWEDAELGGASAGEPVNVVFHEFAHVFDMASGEVDGRPVFLPDDLREEWDERLEDELDRLRDDDARGRDVALDVYGTSDASEFFAVSVESFLQTPLDLLADRPGLYDLLARWTRQDPVLEWAIVDPLASVYRARLRLEADAPRDALRLCEEALALEARFGEAHAIAGLAHRALGDADRALESFTTALEIDARDVEARVARATLLAERGDLAAALRDLDRAVRDEPEYAPAYEARAGVHESRGDAKKARRDRDRAARAWRG